MLLKITGVALLSATLLAGGAIAQTTSTKGHSDKSTATTSMHREGQWRSSKLVGLNVYNEKNEKIGDINDIILDKSGKWTTSFLALAAFSVWAHNTSRSLTTS